VKRPGAHWHRADLLDPQQVASLIEVVQPTDLLHLAWSTKPGQYWTSPENFRWVQASLNLLQCFALHGGKRIVVAGTCAEYDWQYGYCSEETTPLGYRGAYGTCKRSLHRLLEEFAKQAALKAAWGRVFFFYGPHEHPSRLVASVVTSILRNEPARCSHGEQMRDFLHVQDVADAFVALLRSDVSGAVNIASGRAVSIKEMVGRIAEVVGRPATIEWGALPAPEDDPPVLVADVKRLTDTVGWRPRYDLDSGLKQTIEWWRNEIDNRHGDRDAHL
jgi:nucleoside-diphosphate-sugar epimerase